MNMLKNRRKHKSDHKQSWGLTIPAQVKADLPKRLIKTLQEDGHGISFNSEISLQMRYVFEGKDFGGSYPLSKYGTWKNAIMNAMKDNQRLQTQYPNSSRTVSPHRGVRFCERLQKNRTYAQYSYQVHYFKDDKPAFKSFYCGTENTMSTARKKHAELTAWHFRRLYCEDLDPEVFSAENTKNWQTKKYYV